MMSKKINYKKLIISLAICQLAGVIGSVFTTPKIPNWYASLIKPTFNPPGWIFGPVWILLFILMGISLYLIWTANIKHKKTLALTTFFIQLCLNTLWSILFFGFMSPFAALIEIVFLWIAILATIIFAHKISSTAGKLLIPYLVWVSFAMILNTGIWVLNP